MTEWIDINIPWDADHLVEDNFRNENPPPTLEKEVLEKFGKTISVLINERDFSLDKDNKIEMHLFHKRNELDRNFGWFNCFDEILLKEMEEKIHIEMMKDEDLITQQVYLLNQEINKIQEFIDNHPKIIEYYENYQKYIEENKIKTFCELELNKPGTLIEIDWIDCKHNKQTKQYLIGTINSNKGCCDCHSAFSDDTIVKRYKIIWEETNE